LSFEGESEAYFRACNQTWFAPRVVDGEQKNERVVVLYKKMVFARVRQEAGNVVMEMSTTSLINRWVER